MPISENLVQEIVQEVMAKMQIADAPSGKHGVFKDMNEAIEEAKACGKGYVIDCLIDIDEMVRPMVGGGSHITDFMRI